MAKKEQATNVNNNTNIVNVHVSRTQKPRTRKMKKPNWIVKAIVLAVIGLAASIIIIYVKHSTAANGKPAFIQSNPHDEK
jgi:hypothetical protein